MLLLCKEGGNFMSIITALERYKGSEETTLNGVVDSSATYEIFDDVLIIRTTTHDTIHLTREMGKQLVYIINEELL